MKRSLFYTILPAFFILAIVLVNSCNKKAAAYNPDFVGTWRNTLVVDSAANIVRYSEIIIEKRDGMFRYYCSSLCEGTPCNCSAQETGRAIVSTDKKSLKIGSNGTVLSIDKEPFQNNNGEWEMKIQGLVYLRQ